MQLYITFVITSILGMAIKLKMKNDSLKDIAAKGNFVFPTIKGFLIENISSIVWSAVGVALFHVVFGPSVMSIINNSPNTPEPFLWGWVVIARRDLITAIALLLYLTVAYMGQEFVFNLLNRTSKDLRKAIDYKTTIADQATGNTEAPTPIK